MERSTRSINAVGIPVSSGRGGCQFIHANRSAVEMENYDYIRSIIARDFETFSGKQLESLFVALLKQSSQFNRIGGYWDNKGEHEIDIVAINDLEKRLLVVEVKRQFKRFKPEQLATKTEHLLQKIDCAGYAVEQRCFALCFYLARSRRTRRI